MDKKVDIAKRFDHEISGINEILSALSDGRIYEQTKSKSDGTLYNNVEKLRDKLNDLFLKIEYGKESISEEIGRVFFTLTESEKSK